MSKISEIAAAVEGGKMKIIEGLVQGALDAGEDPAAIFNEGMIAAMGSIGEKLQSNEVFVPEMIIAKKTMEKGFKILKPHLAEGVVGSKGKYIIGTVAGDLHDIGKNLVALMIESAGFEVIDLGVDVSPGMFVDAVKANPDCKIVGASSLLTTTMESINQTVIALNEAGLRDRVKIMIGGAPVTQDFCDEIGADAYTPDAGSAAAKAVELANL